MLLFFCAMLASPPVLQADCALLSSHTRTRAMQLLLMVVPHSVVESVTGGALTDLRWHLFYSKCRITCHQSCVCREQSQRAVFVAELAAVQVSMTAEAFQACSKQYLASSLLCSRANSPKVSIPLRGAP